MKTPVALETAPAERRSVFGNYASPPAAAADPGPVSFGAPSVAGLSAAVVPPADAALALARSFLHQYLARAYDYPCVVTWTWLSSRDALDMLSAAVTALETDPAGPLHAAQGRLADRCTPSDFARFHDDYILAIGHAARGSCPINEIEYGDLKADPLFQPHRLADLAAFYRAFGLEIGTLSDERHDHLSVELEFLGVLSAQEAAALNAATDSEAADACRDAQRKFLREHLARWTPAFARRLQHAVGEGPLGALAGFTLAWIEDECRRWGVKAGSEDLLLRPADEAASLCDGCGLANLPPGAVPAA